MNFFFPLEAMCLLLGEQRKNYNYNIQTCDCMNNGAKVKNKRINVLKDEEYHLLL